MSIEIRSTIRGEDHVVRCDHVGCPNSHEFLGVLPSTPESWPGYDATAPVKTPAEALRRYLTVFDRWVHTDGHDECPVDHSEIDYEIALADEAARQAADAAADDDAEVVVLEPIAEPDDSDDAAVGGDDDRAAEIAALLR